MVKTVEHCVSNAEVRKSFITKYVYTHKEFDLTTGASSAEESTDILQTYMIVQTYIGIIQQRWNITLI